MKHDLTLLVSAVLPATFYQCKYYKIQTELRLHLYHLQQRATSPFAEEAAEEDLTPPAAASVLQTNTRRPPPPLHPPLPAGTATATGTGTGTGTTTTTRSGPPRQPRRLPRPRGGRGVAPAAAFQLRPPRAAAARAAGPERWPEARRAAMAPRRCRGLAAAGSLLLCALLRAAADTSTGRVGVRARGPGPGRAGPGWGAEGSGAALGPVVPRLGGERAGGGLGSGAAAARPRCARLRPRRCWPGRSIPGSSFARPLSGCSPKWPLWVAALRGSGAQGLRGAVSVPGSFCACSRAGSLGRAGPRRQLCLFLVLWSIGLPGGPWWCPRRSRVVALSVPPVSRVGAWLGREGCVALLGAALVPCSTLAAQGQLVLVRLLVCACQSTVWVRGRL